MFKRNYLAIPTIDAPLVIRESGVAIYIKFPIFFVVKSESLFIQVMKVVDEYYFTS